jgi:hypothetical protein
MGSYTIFDQLGVIKRVVDCPESMAHLQPEAGESILEGKANDVTQYVDTSTLEIKDKPALPIQVNKYQIQADEVDELIITGLPTTEPNGNTISSFVTVAGNTYEVTDGEFVFTTDVPGIYTIMCEALNYLTETITVEAVDEG